MYDIYLYHTINPDEDIEFKVDDKVKTYSKTSNCWLSGELKSVNNDGTYKVKWTIGTISGKKLVLKNRLRLT